MNGWTGAQYSALRFPTGLVLAWWSFDYFSRVRGSMSASLTPRFADVNPVYLAAGLLCILAIPAAIAFAIGFKDRIAAAIILASFAPQIWLERNPVSLTAIAILIAHLMMPRAPFWTFDARFRTDPSGGWTMPDRAWNVLWGCLALDGVRTLAGLLRYGIPSTVDAHTVAVGLYLFAALAGFHREWRPIAWVAIIVLTFLIPEGGFDDMLRATRIPFLLFLFDPAWIPPAQTRGMVLFYDGWCGLCHGAIRFLVSEDPVGNMRYSPLQGNTISRKLDAATRAQLPDSMVLLTEEGRIHTKSRAVLVAGEGLGGFWRLASAILIHLPAEATDAAYDIFAQVRPYLFSAPKETCPVLPQHLSRRFMS